MQLKPSLRAMARLFERSGLRLEEEQISLLWRYHRLIHERNEALDLTRIRNFENMVVKHYVDSVIVPNLMELPSPLLDIGSGAGLPGIPIKIVRPRIKIILAEGRARRAGFLRETCKTLGLKGIDVFPHKVGPGFTVPVSGVITRALEKMELTLRRAEWFLPSGGLVVFMKGPHCDEELAEALSRRGDDFRLVQDKPYTLAGTPHRRRLVVFEKKGAAKSIRRTADRKPPKRKYVGRENLIRKIESTENSTYKRFLRAAGSRGIKKEGLALLAGSKSVLETLEAFPDRCASLVLGEEHEPPLDPVPDNISVYRLGKDLFERLDIHGTRSPLLIVKVPPMPAWRDGRWPQGCTLFVPFQDPANVGAVIRTAAAFGVARIVLLKEAAHPFHHKSLRAAGNAVFRVSFRRGPSLAKLRTRQVPLFALSPGGTNLETVKFPGTFGLVPGVEGPGLPEGLRRENLVGIPMEPGTESLNAALATGIALYSWRSRIRDKG